MEEVSCSSAPWRARHPWCGWCWMGRRCGGREAARRHETADHLPRKCGGGRMGRLYVFAAAVHAGAVDAETVASPRRGIRQTRGEGGRRFRRRCRETRGRPAGSGASGCRLAWRRTPAHSGAVAQCRLRAEDAAPGAFVPAGARFRDRCGRSASKWSPSWRNLLTPTTICSLRSIRCRRSW